MCRDSPTWLSVHHRRGIFHPIERRLPLATVRIWYQNLSITFYLYTKLDLVKAVTILTRFMLALILVFYEYHSPI